jgi:hypothetical protein
MPTTIDAYGSQAKACATTLPNTTARKLRYGGPRLLGLKYTVYGFARQCPAVDGPAEVHKYQENPQRRVTGCPIGFRTQSPPEIPNDGAYVVHRRLAGRFGPVVPGLWFRGRSFGQVFRTVLGGWPRGFGGRFRGRRRAFMGMSDPGAASGESGIDIRVVGAPLPGTEVAAQRRSIPGRIRKRQVAAGFRVRTSEG